LNITCHYNEKKETKENNHNNIIEDKIEEKIYKIKKILKI